MFTEIDGDFDNVAIRTFKVGLPAKHGLRKSLTGKPVNNVRQLKDRINKYKWVEEDHQLGKGKENVVSQDRRDFKSEKYNDNRPWTGLCPSKVMIVAQLPFEDSNHEPKKAKVAIQLALSFSENDKFGTIQLHNDTLVVTLKIGGYDVRHVLVDQGSGVEIMYPNLYKGLGLKLRDLTSYDSPLVGFDGNMDIPMGKVKLPA
ncbi:uncharacterized protein LOC142629328 [Castanea sativa]|uniref:uncharacterized protein LOC142629328 n=1 Tax=Castanea sativa TaxID=21020 RepID=UPI003F650CC6